MPNSVNIVPAMVAPNINGNVSSCTVQAVVTPLYSGLIKSQNKVNLVNSCSGQITDSYITTSYDGAMPLIWTSIVICVLLFAVMAYHQTMKNVHKSH